MVHADGAARVLPPRARVPGGGRVAARLARAGRRDVLRPQLDPLEQEAPVDHAARARGLRRPRRPARRRNPPVPERRPHVGRAQGDAAPAARGEPGLPVHLPDAEVPLGRALDGSRRRLDRDAVRPVRRPVPARPAEPRGRARRTSRSTRRTRSSSGSTTATTPGSTPIRPIARTATGRRTTRTTTSPGR